MRYRVIMICREISRSEAIVDTESVKSADDDLESVKDKAWAQFNNNMTSGLEQENFTKVEVVLPTPVDPPRPKGRIKEWA